MSKLCAAFALALVYALIGAPAAQAQSATPDSIAASYVNTLMFGVLADVTHLYPPQDKEALGAAAKQIVRLDSTEATTSILPDDATGPEFLALSDSAAFEAFIRGFDEVNARSGPLPDVHALGYAEDGDEAHVILRLAHGIGGAPRPTPQLLTLQRIDGRWYVPVMPEIEEFVLGLLAAVEETSTSR